MPKKVTTAWEIAKPILEKWHIDGVVTDTMSRGEVHGLCDEFKAAPIGNFGSNFLRMKRTIGGMKEWAARDKDYLQPLCSI